MFNNDLFCQRLKELRQYKKINQTVLGQEVGLSMQAVSDIENGRRTTTIEKLIAFADFFNVSLDYLVGRSDDKKITNGNIGILSKEDELIKNFRSLDDVSKGKLIERSRILLEESVNPNSVKKNA